jgi:hypothetical protein
MDHEQDADIVALQEELDSFIQGSSSDPYFWNDPANGFDGLPDGSALYGILFHKTGPAVNDFAACSQSQFEDMQGNMPGNIKIRNTVIKDLHLKSDEVVKMMIDGKPVLGPAGDVVQMLRLKAEDGSYTGTALSNAQLRLAELKAAAREDGMALDDLFANYGSTNIPPKVVAWMKGQGSYEDATADVTWACGGDAMSHVNKGVVGLRLEFVSDVSLKDVTISGLKNVGTESKYKGVECGTAEGERYLGGDVRGVSIGGGTQLEMKNNAPRGVWFQEKSCSSASGSIAAFVNTGKDNIALAGMME